VYDVGIGFLFFEDGVGHCDVLGGCVGERGSVFSKCEAVVNCNAHGCKAEARCDQFVAQLDVGWFGWLG
jgi:hypothetical protein